jgi:hypothetical protein
MATLAGSMFALVGCQPGPYLSDYSYQPRPGIYEVRKHGAEQQAPPLTALVTILGIRRADPDHHVAPAIDVRLRFESNGSEPATFDPASLDLVTGTLRSFPRPYVSPPTSFELSPGQQQNVTASFPFPPNTAPGQMDLNELRLRWVVHVGGFPVAQTALFERLGSGYGDGDYAPAPMPQSDVAY